MLLCCASASAQTFTEKLILQDDKDSLYLKSEGKHFDRAGNYCFEIKQGDTSYFVTAKGRSEGVLLTSTAYGNNGGISTSSSYADRSKPWHYRNANGGTVYGPLTGELKNYVSSGSGNNIALTVSNKDSVLFYLDGKLIAQNSKYDLSGFNLENEEWCVFSENGNRIYFLKNGPWFMLYVNGILIDKSREYYREMHINDNGKYTYGEGRKPELVKQGYEYTFYVHTGDTVLGPVRTVWNTELGQHDGYYYTGDDNGTDYIAINNRLYKGIENIGNIIIPDKVNYMFSFQENGTKKWNVNGKIYDPACKDFYRPEMDTKGNFAFYGIKDYYLYKYINGKQQEKPLTRYGVRPVPVYISPAGESIHYFKTDDSLYLYRDEALLFSPISDKANFVVDDAGELMDYYYEKRKLKDANSLQYLEYGPSAYFIYNGVFSKPMLPALERGSAPAGNFGPIVAGVLNHSGFFVIQKTGDAKFLVNVNNKVYRELDRVQVIFKENCFFDEKELVFYGIKDQAFYQFKLSL